jgi:hypothetical protein
VAGHTITNKSPIILPYGSFKEDFVFDLANPFVNVPDNVPLLRAQAFLGASNPLQFSSASVQLYNSAQTPIGIISPGLGSFLGPYSGASGSYYQARSEALIHSGADLVFEVTGFANVGDLPLNVSVSAFDLGPVVPVLPEPSTWAMTLLGFAGLGLAYRRTSRGLPAPAQTRPGRQSVSSADCETSPSA